MAKRGGACRLQVCLLASEAATRPLHNHNHGQFDLTALSRPAEKKRGGRCLGSSRETGDREQGGKVFHPLVSFPLRPRVLSGPCGKRAPRKEESPRSLVGVLKKRKRNEYSRRKATHRRRRAWSNGMRTRGSTYSRRRFKHRSMVTALLAKQYCFQCTFTRSV